MPIQGTPKFDLVVLLEARCSFISGNTTLRGKAAYASSTSGMTHGSTSCTRWSKDTLDLLAALRQSMEADIAARDFQDVQGEGTGTSKEDAPSGGIGEHLVGDASPA